MTFRTSQASALAIPALSRRAVVEAIVTAAITSTRRSSCGLAGLERIRACAGNAAHLAEVIARVLYLQQPIVDGVSREGNALAMEVLAERLNEEAQKAKALFYKGAKANRAERSQPSLRAVS